MYSANLQMVHLLSTKQMVILLLEMLKRLLFGKCVGISVSGISEERALEIYFDYQAHLQLPLWQQSYFTQQIYSHTNLLPIKGPQPTTMVAKPPMV